MLCHVNFSFLQLFSLSVQESRVSAVVDVDPRCHSRLIGQRGRAIHKIMQDFGVEVKFPSDKNSPEITISGPPENVDDCKEHILLIVEEQVSGVRKSSSVCLCVCLHP